jgi:hypothetical protein
MGNTKQKQEPYEGDIMHHFHLQPSAFVQLRAVVVTGAAWNPCGHMLLNTRNGYYFHINERKGRPKFMTESGYSRYLRETGKKETRRYYIDIPNPNGSHQKLRELLAKPWGWWLLPNNCVSFVEDVVQAGGSKVGLYSNCPTRERLK